MTEIEKDFQTIAQLIAKHLIASTGSTNPNAFNALSKLHSEVLSAWSVARPPPAGS